MADVFISYAQGDEEKADRLKAELERQGLGVFEDAELVLGQDWQATLDDAMQTAKAVVVLLSAASQSGKLPKSEAQRALTSKPIVIPVLLDDMATENFLWPLLANRITKQVSTMDEMPALAKQIGQLLKDPEAMREDAPGRKVSIFSKLRKI